MRTTSCFLVLIFLATVVASTSTSTTTSTSANDMEKTYVSNRLRNSVRKSSRLPNSAGKVEGMSSSETVEGVSSSIHTMNIPTSTDITRTTDTRFETIEHERRSFGNGRRFKICSNHGHCYGKKLVCPKKCLNHNSPTHLESNQGRCTFNCKKCIAHC